MIFFLCGLVDNRFLGTNKASNGEFALKNSSVKRKMHNGVALERFMRMEGRIELSFWGNKFQSVGGKTDEIGGIGG